MSFRTFLACASLGLAALASAPAAAQQLEALQKACGADIKALCAGIQPGGGRIKQCVIEKKDKLSDGCKAAIGSAKAAAATARN